jgi:hypothetical protein
MYYTDVQKSVRLKENRKKDTSVVGLCVNTNVQCVVTEVAVGIHNKGRICLQFL